MKEFVLPFNDVVIHPGTTMPLFINHPAAIACIQAANAPDASKRIVIVPQRTGGVPTDESDIYHAGVLADITNVLRLPDGGLHCIIQARTVVKLDSIMYVADGFVADVTPIEITDSPDSPEIQMLRDKIVTALISMAEPAKRKSFAKLRTLIHEYPTPAFVDYVVQVANFETDNALKILLMNTWTEKLTAILYNLGLMAENAKIEATINRRVQQRLDRNHRDAILQEKLRVIHQELGDDSEEMDVDKIRKRIESAHLPAPVMDKALSEWRRMRNMSPMSNEGGLLKSYLDELLAMPWNKSDKSKIDLTAARKILDNHHSGMQAVKERILEHIAVMKKTGGNRGGILCLVGAPGVGKTSLCKSIAQALGRKYQRISLGGISDESHFRGHRKTYIGAQTGRIMDALKRCGVNNPVIVLDEIDKMGRDWRGDPESALLEILDPEQNKTFRDHYLEVDFDLSNVMFIATANSLNLSNALKDRMEIIEIPGYSVDEKIKIAHEHLIGRAAYDTGWNVDNIKISDDAVRHVIQKYTSEQGVRQLQRELTAILRRQLLENDGEDAPTEFTISKIDDLLSIRKNSGLSNKIGFSAQI
ncbi:MAG: AAA family ATPase [Alphaproteobacteria bacterium]|nr:AAA family ATPase [Alphaproteobacteria bacterium]